MWFEMLRMNKIVLGVNLKWHRTLTTCQDFYDYYFIKSIF